VHGRLRSRRGGLCHDGRVTDPGSSDWQSPGGPAGRPRYGEFAAPRAAPGAVPPVVPPPSPYDAVPPPPGWTPPPKPGIVPLRPIAFGTLLSAPFAMLRRSPGIVGLSFLIQLGVLLLSGGVLAGIFFAGFARITDWSDPEQAPLIAGSIAGSVIGGIVLLALNYVTAALLQGIVVAAVARATLGERPTVRDVWPQVKGRMRPLIAWTLLAAAAILVALLVIAGIILLGVSLGPVGIAIGISVGVILGLGAIVAGFWVFTKLCVVPSVIVLERAGIRSAVVRSWSLTTGFFWRTLGVQLLVTVILSIAAQIITAPLSLLQVVAVLIDPNGTGSAIVVTVAVQILTVVLSIFIGAITTFLMSTLVALIYLDLRMRKEGLDLVLQRHVEGGNPSADPFAPGAA
jgi:membrane-anchored glycerophosphoryl diester phosphodiesterase (GDPDase)